MPSLIRRREFLKGSALSAAALLVPLGPSLLAAVDTDSFRARRERVLDAAAASPTSCGSLFWAAQALFVRDDLSRGLQIWQEAVARQKAARVRGVGLFNLWPAVHGLARWGGRLDAESTEILRTLLTTFPEYSSMRTSNLVMLAQVTRHLAGQVFGEAAFSPLSHYRADDPDASRALRKTLEDCARRGFGEWASWPYFDKILLPVASIAQLSADATLRRMAAVTFEAGLAQSAAFWLNGRWAMPTARSYPDLLGSKPWGGPQALWLYLGGIAPEISGNLVGAATMDQEVPAILEAIAADRSRPFSSTGGFGRNRQLAFLDRGYGLFCEMQDTVQNWGQCYPYGVMWSDPDPSRHTFLWLTAPVADSPETISPSHPHGVLSACQSNLQHGSALLYVFDFDPAGKAPGYALGFVPGGFLASRNDAAAERKIFLHYPGVLIAISSSREFFWDPDSGIRAPSGKPLPGDSEFRVQGPRFAMAIECGHPADFPGCTPEERLDAFRCTVRERSRIAMQDKAGSYTDRQGNLLERVFHGAASINGTRLDLAATPLLDNPWMKQDRGGPLTVVAGKSRRVYDFDRWEIAAG